MKNLLAIVTFFYCYYSATSQSTILNKADSLYLNGNYSKAITIYKQSKDSAAVFDKIAKAYMALGIYDEALNSYRKSIAVNQDEALLKYDFAKLLSKTKKYKEASEVFYKLIDIDYRNPNYHYELGMVLEQLNDSTSQNRFYSAFQMDRTHQKAIYRMAKFHLRKGRNNLVDYYVDIGLESYANNKELINLKAQNYYVRKDYDNAAIWFEKLLALNESTQFIHEKLRNCYAQQYEFKKALDHGQLALKFDKNNTNNLFVQGELFERIGDFKNAEKFMLQSLLFQDQALDNEYIKLASVYNRQEKHQEAIDAFKRAVEENPKNERAQFLLIYTKDQYYKDIDTRIELYQTFKEKYPQSKFRPMADYRITELKKEKFLKTD